MRLIVWASCVVDEESGDVCVYGRWGAEVLMEQTAKQRLLVLVLALYHRDQSTSTPANVERVASTNCRENVFRCRSLHSTSSIGSSTLAHRPISTTSTLSANESTAHSAIIYCLTLLATLMYRRTWISASLQSKLQNYRVAQKIGTIFFCMP